MDFVLRPSKSTKTSSYIPFSSQMYKNGYRTEICGKRNCNLPGPGTAFLFVKKCQDKV